MDAWIGFIMLGRCLSVSLLLKTLWLSNPRSMERGDGRWPGAYMLLRLLGMVVVTLFDDFEISILDELLISV